MPDLLETSPDQRPARATIDRFLGEQTLALAGASRRGKKFGNILCRNLSDHGYDIRLVHPRAEKIDGFLCYPNLAALPSSVGGLICVIPPAQALELVWEAAETGIGKIWLQQGSESAAAIARCREHGMEVIAGECLLMFAEPVAFPHRCHRYLKGLLGRLPR